MSEPIIVKSIKELSQALYGLAESSGALPEAFAYFLFQRGWRLQVWESEPDEEEGTPYWGTALINNDEAVVFCNYMPAPQEWCWEVRDALRLSDSREDTRVLNFLATLTLG